MITTDGSARSRWLDIEQHMSSNQPGIRMRCKLAALLNQQGETNQRQAHSLAP
ncbi:MAG: hypothetical protein NW220_01440 [Leptolyngbyaceae cyanobacterium bins.349]|nr:hypothetical protein [Leptolyngbyaceae cyanobacterium bins.349]